MQLYTGSGPEPFQTRSSLANNRYIRLEICGPENFLGPVFVVVKDVALGIGLEFLARARSQP